MEMIRDKEEISEADKKAWFKDVYVQYVKKITATSNLKSFLEHPTVQPFNRLGLVPPSFASETELDAKIANLKEVLQKLQLAMAMKKDELQRIQKSIGAQQAPTEEQQRKIKDLNAKIIDQNQKTVEIQGILRETEGNRGQYVAYDESDAQHAAHFNTQFEVFMNRANPSVVVRKNTSKYVDNVLHPTDDTSSAQSIQGLNETAQGAPGSDGSAFTESF